MTAKLKPAILLIGGLDPQGCAGMVADVQTVAAHRCHPVPLLTCMTEQTSNGLTKINAISSHQFMQQYLCCVADFDIAAIKIGLIPNANIALCISDIIKQHDIPVILDPVLTTTSGGLSIDHDVQTIIMNTLLPSVTLLTPNLPEFAILAGLPDITLNKFKSATKKMLAQYRLNACLVKGGHTDAQFATDYFRDSDRSFYCYQKKHNNHARATGCILASSIASLVALNYDMYDAVVLAKAYITKGIRQASKLNCYHVFEHDMSDLQLQDLPKLCDDDDLIGYTFNFKKLSQPLDIYPIVDSSVWVNLLIKEGIRTLQLRIKDKPSSLINKEVNQAVAYCKQTNAVLFINDYWQAAIDAHAYGVHLGQTDLGKANLSEIEQAGLRLGISTHSYWELARAITINPSYIALGPVFATKSKQMTYPPQGTKRVKQWVKLLGNAYPLVAIGGINQERAKQLKQTGVASIAMISAITQADDYKKATKALLACWQTD